MTALTWSTATAAALTTIDDRLSFDAWVWLIAFKRDAWDFTLEQALNVTQQFVFIDTHQRNRFTGGFRTASTANTVNVVFRYVWQLIVDDVRQLVDVQTARRDVSSYQHANAAVFEICQCASTGTPDFYYRE
ncbi:Uncharacterised protein [Ewingella americana]|uniref:Uncharacterized protein n=1 Tax=Ewingella americana TaxID=41202 RepID=A0A377NG41_9GAMM|nr:Uncharacterised protein [Ewingella americana]